MSKPSEAMKQEDGRVTPPLQSHCCSFMGEQEEIRVESNMKGTHDENMLSHLTGLSGGRIKRW